MSALLIALFFKSALIAGTGLALSALVARRPVDRSDILRATVVLLLLLPLAIAFGPEIRLALLSPVEPVGTEPLTLWNGSVRPAEGLTVAGSVFAPSMTEVMAMAWALGAVVVLGRFALGILTLSHWTASARPVEAPAWREALLRQRPRRRPVLRASDQAMSPLSWGLPPGVVLLDAKTLAEPQTAPAVIAHEMAHITRGDWIFLVLSRLALALFWFNPLVWMVHRALIDRSEEAADAIAIRHVDRRIYARALVGLAARTAPVPLAAAAMAAPGPALKQRIAHIMSDTPNARRRPMIVAACIAVFAAVATPIAALEITRAVHINGAAQTPPAPPVPPAAPSGVLAAPPAPSAPPVMNAPEPPAPPAPPAPPQNGEGVWFYRGSDEGSAQAREAAAQAREVAAQARAMAQQHRAEAAQHRQQMAAVRASAEAARQAGEQARLAGEQARAQAEVARREAHQAMSEARIEMRRGAEEMRRGAEEMRREGDRLADPVYRAEQIARSRREGRTVTDAELQALGPRLIRQADELERQADQLAAQGAEAG